MRAETQRPRELMYRGLVELLREVSEMLRDATAQAHHECPMSESGSLGDSVVAFRGGNTPSRVDLQSEVCLGFFETVRSASVENDQARIKGNPSLILMGSMPLVSALLLFLALLLAPILYVLHHCVVICLASCTRASCHHCSPPPACPQQTLLLGLDLPRP